MLGFKQYSSSSDFFPDFYLDIELKDVIGDVKLSLMVAYLVYYYCRQERSLYIFNDGLFSSGYAVAREQH
jgi:hypothetical protein